MNNTELWLKIADSPKWDEWSRLSGKKNTLEKVIAGYRDYNMCVGIKDKHKYTKAFWLYEVEDMELENDIKLALTKRLSMVKNQMVAIEKSIK